MKYNRNVKYAVVASVLVLAMTVCLLCSCGKTVVETSGIPVTVPTEKTEATVKTEATTYPPATVPHPETEKPEPEILPMPEGGREIASFESIRAKIQTLDNTLRGYGPGVRYDKDMRPLGAIEEEELFKEYGSHYIFQDDNIYLTFDEGYENGYTATILDILKEKNVKAVFFITYPYAVEEPELVNRMIAEGHLIGSHSTKHLSFPTMELEDAYNDILKLHRYVETHYNYSMTLFRFPMGESSPRTQALLHEMGYQPVFWSFAHADWSPENQPDPVASLQKILDLAHPGALYLLHAVSKTNTEILPDIIDGMREKGFTIAPFPIA